VWAPISNALPAGNPWAWKTVPATTVELHFLSTAPPAAAKPSCTGIAGIAGSLFMWSARQQIAACHSLSLRMANAGTVGRKQVVILTALCKYKIRNLTAVINLHLTT
jgi:mannose/fructose/N-acetylgalactosamine-specific phosphotransferase system component IIC